MGLACGLALHARPALAQATTAPDAAATRAFASDTDLRLRLGGERVRLPGGERMGLVGMTALFSVGDEWWAGPAVYGAATGRRGGLFVPGVEGAWSHPFNTWMAIDAGLFAGGGGGGQAPVGGGLMVRPHVDLVFALPGFYTGPTWSLVRFPNGAIDSRQFGWMLTFDSSFRVRPIATLQAGAKTDGAATGLGFDRIDATFTRETPRAGARSTTGQPMTQAIGLVGVRAERTVDGPLWAGIETAGAATGGVAGYAEVLGTAGLRFPVIDHRLSLGVRASAGLGGGGAIDTGGGLLLKGAAGATLRVTESLGFGAEAGLVDAPRRAHFSARSFAVSMNWTLGAPRPNPLDSWDARPATEATRTEFSAGAERYRAARKNGRTQALDAVTLQVNRFIAPMLYVGAQTHSAFAGGAGAYTVGLFGVGVQWPVASRLRVGAEAFGGAAGGGGVDTGGGKVVQGRGYADVALTDSLSLRVGGGKIKSARGGLDASVVDAALVFSFGVDRAAGR
ncbi:MAG: hypothetical protein ABW032_08100 [Burkholderiaceae bacterium]